MTHPAPVRRAAVLLVAALLGGLLAVTPGVGAAAAPADLRDARAEAHALRVEVDRLEIAAAVAVEDYNEAQESLAKTVTAHLLAQRRLDTVAETHAVDVGSTTQRVRALYMSGGGTVLYASVLGADNADDAVLRTRTVGNLIRGDVAVVATGGAQVAQAADAAAELDRLATERIQRQQEVEAAAREVTALLAATATRLAEADAEVVRLAEEERRRLAVEEAVAAAEYFQELQERKELAEQREREERAREQAQEAAAQEAAAREAERVAQETSPPHATPRPAQGRTTEDSAERGRTTDGADPRTVVPLRSVPRAVEPSPQEAAPAPSDPGTEAEQAVAAARTVLGRPYQWGATGPNTFDCSGLTQWAYRQAGVEIPRVSRAQWYSGPRVALADLAVGDLLFWAEDTSDPASIYHVGMYIGGAEVLYAPRTGDVVKIGPVRLSNLIGAVRPAPSEISGRRAA